ncbi:MAG: dihydroxy-acid dehydratase [Cloacibacillus evryensis]
MKKRRAPRIIANKINDGDVVVIRYRGPKGGPGCAKCSAPPQRSWARAKGGTVALITDGRFPVRRAARRSATSRPKRRSAPYRPR